MTNQREAELLMLNLTQAGDHKEIQKLLELS